MLFKRLLKEAMDERKLSVKDVCTLTGLKEYIVEASLDGATPDFRHEKKLCDLLHIDEDLITYDKLSISPVECAMYMGEGYSALFVKNAIEQDARKGKQQFPGTYTTVNGVRKFQIPREAFFRYMEEWNNDSALRLQMKELQATVIELCSAVSSLTKSLGEVTKKVVSPSESKND